MKILQLTTLLGEPVYVLLSAIQYIATAQPAVDAPLAKSRLQLSGTTLAVRETPEQIVKEIQTLIGSSS